MRNVLFSHIPKNGGMAIKHAIKTKLKTIDEDIRPKLMYYGHKPLTLETSREHSDYFKFAVVRNPWERIASMTYPKRSIWPIGSTPLPEGEIRSDGAVNTTIKSIIEASEKGYKPCCGKLPYVRLPQHKYVMVGNIQIVDYIARYENLKDDMYKISQVVGFDISVDQKINYYGDYDYRALFDDETIELVRKYYDIEIKMFGYSFKGEVV